jgi:glutathione synthase/RimK-type ligase-like ATP-grasp enzyme
MLLFLDQSIDLHADWVEAECDRRGVPFVRFCTEDFPQRVRIVLCPMGGALRGRILFPKREVDLDDVKGVWFRRPGAISLDPGIPAGSREFAQTEAKETLSGLYRALEDRRWVSPAHCIAAAGYKIHQLRLAVQLGFEVPPTLITNEPAEALEFFDECGGEVVYKPLRFVLITDDTGAEHGIYTTLMNREDLQQHAESVRITPCLFQKLMRKKHELRVNVIGDRVWTAAIYSQETEHTSLDFRLDTVACRHAPVFLPPGLERLCLEMTRRLGLRMSSIDLIVTPDDRYIFLELNPNGQWVWIEDLTGLPLAAALVDELLGVDTLASHPYLRDRSLEFAADSAAKSPR